MRSGVDVEECDWDRGDNDASMHEMTVNVIASAVRSGC